MSQNPKPLRERKHKQKNPIKATWPATADQRKQSRPVIIMHPVRRRIEDANAAGIGHLASLIRADGFLPKHELDRLTFALADVKASAV